MSSLVRISDMSLYVRCPRLIYFDVQGNLPRIMNPDHLLLRSLMLSISGETDIEGQLGEALSRLELELPMIYEIDPAQLGPACREMERRIPEMANGLAPHINSIIPSEVEVDLRSDRLGLSGRLDRLVIGGCIPSIIRTGHAPEDGIWKRDRLMLAGYSLLLAETYGKKVNIGYVEYPRSSAVREVEIHSIDRSRVLRIRDRIRQIKEGRLPERPVDARCEECDVRARCETRHSLASKFF
jgi:CRISPR-associated exonuclease Cas4